VSSVAERGLDLLADLEEDRRSAPEEYALLAESYIPRVLEAVLRRRSGRVSDRELEAHLFQIRLAYTRDLQRLLPVHAASPRFVRTA
jgi:hypothetical protein